MPDNDAKYRRQARLPEVGEHGQARLLAAEARVPPVGLAHEIEARYLAGAGVTVVRAPRAHEDFGALDPEPGHAFADPAARAVAEGARRALDRIAAIVFGEDTS